MKRKTVPLLCAVALLLPLASCSFLSGPDYELMVTIESGVKGSPAGGLYTHAELDAIDYDYDPLNALHTVEVMIDGVQEAANDTLTIYHRTTLVARLIDIRSTWNVTSKDSSGNSTTFTITFSGDDILGGTFSDSRGYAGTWTGKSNALVITYSNWEAYIYSGTLFKMNGTWANGTATGTWSAKKQ